jgi:hypothetical protein
MASFTDNKGTVWEVPFTIHQAMRIKAVLGIDLAQVGAKADAKAAFDELVGDFARMVNILFVCCEKQAKELNVGDQEFAERMDLQVFGDGLEAFTVSFVDFFLKGPAKERARTILGRKGGILGRGILAAEEKVLAKLESFGSASASPASAG